MAVTPSLETIRQSYVTYADYEETGNQASCKSFITACRRLLVMLAAASEGVQGTRTEFEIAEIRAAMEDAQAWLSANPSTADDLSKPLALHHDFDAFTERT
jgi:hypothetical protein